MSAVGEHWTVQVDKALRGRNDQFAADNRAHFRTAGVFVLNIVSSPGAGKTLLLERTLAALREELRIGVQVGDLQTDNDARRLSGHGASVVQIVTNGCCHLEAGMVAKALESQPLGELDLLIIENVGNLVCPASYDLGEDMRIVLVSVTEGEDKPLKYPTIFRNAQLVVITKLDLVGPAGVDLQLLRENVRRAAPQAHLFELSARTGEGLMDWYAYLRRARSGQAGAS